MQRPLVKQQHRCDSRLEAQRHEIESAYRLA
jgi:hypothetical protein